MVASQRGSALALFRPRQPAAPPASLGGSQLALPSGRIAGDLRPVSVDMRRRTAIFELLIANETSRPIATFAYAAGNQRPGGRIRWSAITVPPLCSVAVPFVIALPRRGAPQRVVAEVHAEGAHLTLDAKVPDIKSRSRLREGKMVAGAAAMAASLAAGYLLERPQISALATPAQVQAGHAFQIAYAIAGAKSQSAEYALETSDGREVGRGRIDPAGGSFIVGIPRAKVATGYDVRITARNVLGSGARVAHVVALVPPPSPHAKKRHGIPTHLSAHLKSDAVDGGAQIVVRYATDAKAGVVKLLDQEGTERASALLNRRGYSILIAPNVDVDQDFRVVVDARHGTSTAEAMLPVRIQHVDPGTLVANAPPIPPVTNGLLPPTEVKAVGNAPIALAKHRFKSEGSIGVDVLVHAPQLSVALLNASGEELQRVDVAPGQKKVVLSAPPVAIDTRFSVVTSFTRGFGQESVINSIVVHSN